NRRAMVFRDYLAQWQFYDLAPHRLRDARSAPLADALKPDGSNLVSALYHLKNSDETRHRRLIELAQTIEQRIDTLNFAMVGDYIQMELMDAQGHRFNVASVSDGALRFMGLCHIVLNNTPRLNPPLIVIEEPEDALYVPKLKPLFQSLDASGDSGQYIFTSHSLYMIPMLSEHLKNIIIMQDQGTHSVLTRPDLAEARHYIEQIPIDKLYP
ncbi:MAG: AAA family ATPase, partial [Delftia sp.]|nr:AAA family ATPase [Delftia sp.]